MSHSSDKGKKWDRDRDGPCPSTLSATAPYLALDRVVNLAYVGWSCVDADLLNDGHERLTE